MHTVHDGIAMIIFPNVHCGDVSVLIHERLILSMMNAISLQILEGGSLVNILSLFHVMGLDSYLCIIMNGIIIIVSLYT